MIDLDTVLNVPLVKSSRDIILTQGAEIVELEKINRVIPLNEEIILVHDKGLLTVVSDFDKGGVVSSVQKKGRGPGEVVSVTDIASDLSYYMVSDGSRAKLIFYDKHWNLMVEKEYASKSGKNIFITKEFVYLNDRLSPIGTTALLRYPHHDNVLTFDGQKPEPLINEYFKRYSGPYADMSFAVSDGIIVYAIQSMPYVFICSTKGEIMKVIQFKGEIFENLNYLKRLNDNEGMSKKMFDELYIDEKENILILLNINKKYGNNVLVLEKASEYKTISIRQGKLKFPLHQTVIHNTYIAGYNLYDQKLHIMLFD